MLGDKRLFTTLAWLPVRGPGEPGDAGPGETRRRDLRGDPAPNASPTRRRVEMRHLNTPPKLPARLNRGRVNMNISGERFCSLVYPGGDNSISYFPLNAAQERADPSEERPGSSPFVVSISLYSLPT